MCLEGGSGPGRNNVCWHTGVHLGHAREGRLGGRLGAGHVQVRDDTADICEMRLLELEERHPLRNLEVILAIRWRRDVEMEDPDVKETMDREYIRLGVTFVSRF